LKITSNFLCNFSRTNVVIVLGLF